MYVIGIDIGGTTVKAGLIEGTKIISKLSAKTDTEQWLWHCDQAAGTFFSRPATGV